jgi:polyphosphate kinase
LIDDEIKCQKDFGNGRIILKLNSLVDDKVIMKLYQASSAGIKIDLIVRGICRLIPQKKDLSENINVYSIVGRFLEHSRAFYFYNNGDPIVLSGSADVMERNFDRRVEILFPIEDKRIKEEFIEILNLYLTDNIKCRVLNNDGSYTRKYNLETGTKDKLEKVIQNTDIQEYFVANVKKKYEAEIKKEHRKKLKKRKKNILNYYT